MSKNIHIRFDWAIKRLLRQKTNFGILEGFLTELLNFDVKIQEILESESNKIDIYNKFNRVDILAKDDKNQLILIEIQNEKQHDYFHRMNYGQAKLISEHISQGDTYDKIKKVFSVNIVYFELGQGRDYIYIGKNEFRGYHFQDVLQLSDKQKENYKVDSVSDIFTTYYILKVNSFDDVSKSSLDEWIYFLKNSEIKDEFKAKGIQEAKEKLRIDNLKGVEKEEYEIFIKDQRNKESEVKTAYTDGVSDAKKTFLPIIEQKNKILEQKDKILEQKDKELEQERQKAEQERQKAEQERQKLIITVKKLKEKGFSIDEIIEMTNLSKEEIEKL